MGACRGAEVLLQERHLLVGRSLVRHCLELLSLHLLLL